MFQFCSDSRLICVGIGLLLFLSCSNIYVLAQKTSITAEEISRTENEAFRLKNFWNEQSARQALALFLKASEQWQSINDPQNTARCLREAVKLKIMLDEETSSAELVKKSLNLDKKAGNIGGEAETFILLTVVSFKTGENKQSRFYHQQAVLKAEKADNESVNAMVFFYSAAFYLNEQNFSEMKKQLEKSLEIYQRLGNKQGETEVLTELAYGYTLNNDRITGRNFAQKALEIAKEINSPRAQTFALIALGDSNQRMGELEKAIKAFYEAEKLFPENLDINEKAILINRIGFYYLAFDELEKAKRYFSDSLELFNKLELTDGSSMLLSLLAQISVRQNNFADADKYFEESRKVLINSRDFFGLATLESEMGDYFLKLENFDKAQIHLQNALAFSKKLGVSYKIAEAESKIGVLYEKKGELKKARAAFSTALELNKKILSKFAQSGNYYDLAKIDFTENQMESSLENISKSIELTELSQNETSNLFLKRTYFSNVFQRYEFYINLLMGLHKQMPDENYTIQALQIAEKSRARSMLENLSLSEADFTKDADPETVRREKEIRFLLNAQADNLTDLLSQNAEKSETDKISKEINELQSELEEIKANLKQNSPVYSAIKNPAPFDVGEFQKNILDDDSLLLEFSFGDEESYLWLVEKTEFGSFVLPPREQIESKIQTLRELLASREMLKDESIEDYQTRIKKAEANYLIIAKELSRDLFGQVADKFGNKRLIVVPDGKLGYFPVSALPLPNNENNEPILLSNEVIYEPSASTLSILAKNNQRKNPASKSLLIFSDPVFSADDSRLSPENKNDLSAQTGTDEKFRFVESLNSLARLDNSKTEADSIVDILGNSNADNFSGFTANREKLLNVNAADYKILHFATHGLIDESRPELSGIVLSRFDENGNKSDEFFRLHDIYGMNLNSDLVVLSACNTGIGKEVRGEGLMSLNNAFLSVGAKSVMSSLWKVEDGATLELMKNFYDAMANENLTPSKALQQAQIKMRRNGRYQSPFYWAAFTVQGDFRNVPEISRNYGYWIYLLPLAAVFIFGLFGITRFIQRRTRK